MAKYRYHVERLDPDLLDSEGWRTLFGSEGSKAYCEGWMAALDSCYPPSRPMRIIQTHESGVRVVIRETKGRSAPRLA